jgi:hypothetical protein
VSVHHDWVVWVLRVSVHHDWVVWVLRVSVHNDWVVWVLRVSVHRDWVHCTGVTVCDVTNCLSFSALLLLLCVSANCITVLCGR